VFCKPDKARSVWAPQPCRSDTPMLVIARLDRAIP
jgi:hypothetical protein